MDTSLEMYNLLILNKEETENLNRPITSNEIESVIKKFPTDKIPETVSQVNPTKHLQKSKHLSFSNYSKKLLRNASKFILQGQP